MSSVHFDAFISYRRSDGKHVANWLRRALQSYRVPRALRERHGQRLNVYLDTAYERGASDFYENTIRPALLSSRWLLVVATPDARLRGPEDIIQREVADFANGPNGRNVIAVRGSGQFNDPLPADVNERFPRIEVVDLRGASRFSFLNPVRTARLSAEKLKLVASLLDLPTEDMPALRQEEELRQQVRSGSAIGASLGVLTAVSALSVYALQSRYQATRALEDTLFTTGSMVLAASRDEQKQSYIVMRGCDLIDELSRSSGLEPQIAERVACGLERAKAREEIGEDDLALAEYDNAIKAALDRHAMSKRIEASEAALRAQQGRAEYHVRQKRLALALEGFQSAADTARQLQADHAKASPLLVAEGNALGRKGDLLVGLGDHAGARDAFEGAASAVQRSLALLEDETKQGTITWLARLHRLAADERRALKDNPGAVAELKKGAAAIGTVTAESMTAELMQEAAIGHAYLFDLAKERGDSASAEEDRRASLDLCERMLSSEKATEEQKRRATGLKQLLLQQEAN